jgi:hypothetical protein
MAKYEPITRALALIFQGIGVLKDEYPSRAFTIDGRLVGDIGEIIATLEYDVVLDDVAKRDHDGKASDGRNVQIKATFREQLTFVTVPDYYLGLKLNRDGSFEEMFNGPGKVISNRYSHRKNIGT